MYAAGEAGGPYEYALNCEAKGGSIMTDVSSLYPPNPLDVPPGLASPSPTYKRRVLIVLLSLLAFIVLYVFLIAGSAYVCYWCFADPAARQARAIADFFQDARPQEDRALKAFDQAVTQVQSEKINEAQFLERVERDVLQPWRRVEQRMQEATDLPSSVQQQWISYLRAREESWNTLCRGIRQNDRAAIDLANQKSKEAERLGQAAAGQTRAFMQSAGGDRKGNGWRVICGILAAVLCLFLVKGLFKWKNDKQAMRIEITEREQPVLFGFIQRVCQDTHAPRPHRVYVSPEVNAAVFYHESILSLFLPTPKNLLIGLGLVNELCLSEFKAVLAHEFGHFSQQTMKLGRYVYTSNRVIADLVFGRDWLDAVVDVIGRLDIRIAFIAWIFAGVLWVVRQCLKGLFRLINFANFALSREMEYNADLMAVTVTGSDALIHGLARLDFASASLAQAWRDLAKAAQHKLYTRDVFYHQKRAGDYLRSQADLADFGTVPGVADDMLQKVHVFKPDDTSTREMWATHPSNYDREVNAKKHYVRGPVDERSPWLLFLNAQALCERMSRLVYEQLLDLKEPKLDAPEAVQALIDEEHLEITYQPRYHGLYDHRYIKPGDLDLPASQTDEFKDPDRLAQAYQTLYDDKLSERMAGHTSRQKEHERLVQLVQGPPPAKGQTLEFRGAQCAASDAGKLLIQVKSELDQDLEWMASLDRQAFLVHLAMASQLGERESQELLDRYRSHVGLQQLHYELSTVRDHVHSMLRGIAGRRELTKKEHNQCLVALNSADRTLSEKLKAADALRLPDLKNVTGGQSLGALLAQRCPAATKGPAALDGTWITPFLERLGKIIDQIQDLHFKSLGRLLALQEEIASRWLAARASATSLEAPTPA
jgi:Zn-dependent protease with chaperone function